MCAAGPRRIVASSRGVPMGGGARLVVLRPWRLPPITGRYVVYWYWAVREKPGRFTAHVQRSASGDFVSHLQQEWGFLYRSRQMCEIRL